MKTMWILGYEILCLWLWNWYDLDTKYYRPRYEILVSVRGYLFTRSPEYEVSCISSIVHFKHDWLGGVVWWCGRPSYTARCPGMFKLTTLPRGNSTSSQLCRTATLHFSMTTPNHTHQNWQQLCSGTTTLKCS